MEQLHPVIRFFSLFYGLICLGSLYVVFRDFQAGFFSKEPLRLPMALIFNLLIIIRSIRKKSLSTSGAFASFIVGFLHIYSNPAFTGALLAFFLSSSMATRYKQDIKKKISGKEFKAGGQRNWIQVMCNGLISSISALMYLIESPNKPAPTSIFGVGVLVANACCIGDTWASELGQVLSKQDPFHIITLKSVPRGTNGGVSLVGLGVSFLGGVFVGFNFLLPLVLFYSLPTSLPLCLSIIGLGGLGGLMGSVVDSVLGALLQYSGVDSNGTIHNHPNSNVKKICGKNILDNDSVNLLSCLITTSVISICVSSIPYSIS